MRICLVPARGARGVSIQVSRQDASSVGRRHVGANAVKVARWRSASRARLSACGHDLYETPACAVRPGGGIWEPCAARGAIVRKLRAEGCAVVAHDLVCYEGTDPINFLLEQASPAGVSHIVTPYKLASAFIRHGLDLGLPFIALRRLMALEGSGCSDLIDRDLRRVWLGTERLPLMHRDGWQGPRSVSAGAPFAWFAFEPRKRSGPIQLDRVSWRETHSA